MTTLTQAINDVFSLYNRAVETDDQSLLPEVIKQWADIFFQHGHELRDLALRWVEHEQTSAASGEITNRKPVANGEGPASAEPNAAEFTFAPQGKYTVTAAPSSPPQAIRNTAGTVIAANVDAASVPAAGGDSADNTPTPLTERLVARAKSHANINWEAEAIAAWEAYKSLERLVHQQHDLIAYVVWPTMQTRAQADVVHAAYAALKKEIERG